jgi:hypothetical protein
MSLTSGPWKWFDYPDGRKLLCGPDRAVIHCPDAPMTCDPEDAGLIAAAPDLLAALKAFIDAYDGDEYASGVWPLMDQARAAIAKAEGRQQMSGDAA